MAVENEYVLPAFHIPYASCVAYGSQDVASVWTEGDTHTDFPEIGRRKVRDFLVRLQVPERQTHGARVMNSQQPTIRTERDRARKPLFESKRHCPGLRIPEAGAI